MDGIKIIKEALQNPQKILPYLWSNKSYLSHVYNKTGRSFLPPIIKLYVNSKCNCSCFFCDVGQRNKESVFYQQLIGDTKEELSINSLQELIRQFGNYKPKIIISGMEPLLSSNIIELLNTLTERKFTVSINTNGVLLPEKGEKLIQAGLRKIMVSIDGPKEIHDNIRGNGVYEKAINGLRLMKDIKERRGLKTEINATACISKFNYQYLEESCSYLLSNNLVDTVSFVMQYFVTPEGSKKHNSKFAYIGNSTVANYTLDKDHFIDGKLISGQVRNLKQQFGDKVVGGNKLLIPDYIDTYYNHPEIPYGNKNCRIPWKRATILANGDCIIHNRCIDFKVGNIHSTPFKEIWNGERYRFFRKELKKHKQFPVCIRCCGVN